MDASDLVEIGEALAEFFDQTCTVSHQGESLGSFGCLVQAQTGAGGNPDPRGGNTSDLSRYNVLMLPEAAPVIVSGDRITTSDGLDLGIVGHDVGKSLAAFITVVGAKQATGAPFVDLVLSYWNPATLSWAQRPVQEVQIVLASLQPRTRTDAAGVVVTELQGTIIGPLDLQVAVNDRSEYEGDPLRVTAVNRSDRTEADFILTRS